MDILQQIKTAEGALELLCKILTDGPIVKDAGICDQPLRVGTARTTPLHDVVAAYVKEWGLFSGHFGYPIPHKDFPNNPCKAFCDASLWDKRTTYGKNRYKLVGYLASRLDEELKLHKACRQLMLLKRCGPVNSNTGICSASFEVRYAIRKYVHEWHLFSGNTMYPVPHPTMTPMRAYNSLKMRFAQNLWDRNTQYGRNRWALVDYLIDRIRADLKYLRF